MNNILHSPLVTYDSVQVPSVSRPILKKLKKFLVFQKKKHKRANLLLYRRVLMRGLQSFNQKVGGFFF